MTPPQTATVAAAPPTPMLPPKLKVGVNYPWPSNKYGVWFGPNNTLDWRKIMPTNLESTTISAHA